MLSQINYKIYVMREVKKLIEIKAPVERVFRALTTSEEIPKYYPLIEVESTWKLGADVLYKGEVDGTPFTDFGVIEAIEPPKLYEYRYWSDNHGTERLPDNYIRISYSLSSSNGGTELLLTQSNIISEDLYQLMETQVWDYLLGSLKDYIERHS